MISITTIDIVLTKPQLLCFRAVFYGFYVNRSFDNFIFSNFPRRCVLRGEPFHLRYDHFGKSLSTLLSRVRSKVMQIEPNNFHRIVNRAGELCDPFSDEYWTKSVKISDERAKPKTTADEVVRIPCLQIEFKTR